MTLAKTAKPGPITRAICIPERMERSEPILTEQEKKYLVGAVFRDADLEKVDFSNADLRHAHCERVSLIGADFTGADLRCAEFRDCDLRRARFRYAKWDHNVLYGSKFSRATGVGRVRALYIQLHGGSFYPSESLTQS